MDEAWRSKLVELAEAERACQWAKGEVIAAAIREAANKKMRSLIFRDAATVLHCSAAYARQLCEVWASFTPVERAQEKTWSLHRACMQAGRRLGRTAVDVLLEALASDLHVRGVDALGREKTNGTQHVLRGHCGGCGVHYVLESTFATPSLPCPVCIRHAWDDGRDGRDAELMGALG